MRAARRRRSTIGYGKAVPVDGIDIDDDDEAAWLVGSASAFLSGARARGSRSGEIVGRPPSLPSHASGEGGRPGEPGDRGDGDAVRDERGEPSVEERCEVGGVSFRVVTAHAPTLPEPMREKEMRTCDTWHDGSMAVATGRWLQNGGCRVLDAYEGKVPQYVEWRGDEEREDPTPLLRVLVPHGLQRRGGAHDPVRGYCVREKEPAAQETGLSYRAVPGKEERSEEEERSGAGRTGCPRPTRRYRTG